MIKQLISIVIALMMMTTVCACGAGGKDSSGQAPEEKAVSETVSEEEQVTGEENTQVRVYDKCRFPSDHLSPQAEYNTLRIKQKSTSKNEYRMGGINYE